MLKAFISGRKNTQNNYAVDFLSINQKQKIVNFAHIFVLGVFILQSSFLGFLLPIQSVQAVTDVVLDECAAELGPDYSTVSKWQRGMFSWSEMSSYSDPAFTVNVTGDASTANWTSNPLVAAVLRLTDDTYTEFPGGSSGTVTKCDSGSTSHYCGDNMSYLVFCDGPICGNGQLDDGEQCDDGNDVDNDGCSSTCENEQATLIVQKIVDQGAASSDAFTMEIRDNTSNILHSFAGANLGTQTSVLPGTYQVTETGGPQDYDLSYSMDCDDGGYLTIASGETKTCVLTNTYNPVPGTLLVQKFVVGGTATSSDWTMNISDLVTFPGSASGTITTLPSGDMYQVVEEGGFDDYVLTYDQNSDCGADGMVSVNPGQQSVCILVNTHIPECGDGLIEGTEECDLGVGYFETGCFAGYGQSCDYCADTCEIMTEEGPKCGDGVRDTGYEECDGSDGVSGPNEVCLPDCTIEYLPHCGDGKVDPGETCDRGVLNGVSCAPGYDEQCNWCTDQCQLITEYGNFCGDGILDSNDGEECDDGMHCSDNGQSCTYGDLSACDNPLTAVCAPLSGDACDDECQMEPGTLTVTKIVDNSQGGGALPSSFTMYIRDAVDNLLYSFPGDSNGTATSVDDGTYYITESTQNNYVLTYDGDCDKATGEVVLNPGESKSCTLTNTYSPPPVQTGELTVQKVVVGGNATSSDWMMNVSGTGVGAFFLGSEAGELRSYPIGEYTVTEATSTPVDGEYVLTYSGACNASGTVVVEDDAPKVCTLTNAHIPVCGDEIVEGDEECDDGNLVDGDGCDSTCSYETSISGCKYSDENNNGQIDDGEAKLGNWGIELWGCPIAPQAPNAFSLFPSTRFVENNDPGVTGACVLQATTTTDSSGCYEFSGLYGGDYGVKEMQSSDWTQTYPAEQTSYYINVPRGTATTSIHFANHKNPICGDGVVNQETEECDGSDGVTSGYHCTSDCTLEKDTPSSRCGDGVKNQSSEECDGIDGVPSGYSCTASCYLKKEGGGGGGGTPPYYITGGGSFLSTPVVKGEEGKPALEVVKEIDREQANPGDLNILYTVRVKNGGSLTAFNVVVEDTLPEGLKFVDHEENIRAWSLENIAAGEEKLIVYGIDVLASTTEGNYVNTVMVSADNHDTIQTSATLEVLEVEVLAATGISYMELTFLMLTSFLFVQTSRVTRKKVKN